MTIEPGDLIEFWGMSMTHKVIDVIKVDGKTPIIVYEGWHGETLEGSEETISIVFNRKENPEYFL